jgi:hypothetical protein
MLPLPPLEVVQVAAKHTRRALYLGDRDAIFHWCSTLATPAFGNEFRGDHTVPGNPPVAAVIEAGAVDRANRDAGPRMPVLAVRPVICQHGHAADLAEGGLAFVRCGVSPFAAIAPIESAGSAIVRAAVGHSPSQDYVFTHREFKSVSTARMKDANVP